MEATFLHDIQIHRHQHPWQHFHVDDFLPEPQFHEIQQQLCKVTTGYHKRDNDLFDLNFMFLPHLSLAKLFLGTEFRDFLEKSTRTRLKIYEKSLVQLRLMTPSSPAFAPHIDDQEERSLVCLWYISPDWQPECGGELTLLKEQHTCPTSADAKIIAPLANRLVFFFSEDTHWHSVNKVQNWNRYSVISEWIVMEEEK